MADDARRMGDAAAADSIARNTAFSFAAQMTTAALTAVLTLFLVRKLGPDGYGIFGLATSISGIVLILADFGISAATARFAAERRGAPEHVASLYVNALKLKFAATGAVCVLLAALAEPIASTYGEPDLVWPIRAIALATFGQSLMLMGDAFFTALGRVAIRLRITATEAFTEVSASIALVLLGAGATGAAVGRFIGYLCGALLSITVALRLIGRPRLHLRRPPSRETVRGVGRYASALMVVDASYVMSSNASVLLIGGYLGSAAAGVFRAPSRLVSLLQYPGMSVANGIAPRVARRPGHEPDVAALQRGLRGLIFFQAVVLAPLIVWAHPAVDLLLGPGYEGAIQVLRLQAPYVFLIGLGPLLTLSINYLGEARRRIPIAVATLVITILGAVILIPRFKLAGAAIATDLAYAFYAFGHLWLCRRALSLAIAPLVKALGFALLAATAMGLVLFAVGTQDLGPLEWVGGLAGGLSAYVGVLLLTRQIRIRDLGVVVAKVRPRKSPGAAGTPAVPASLAESDALPRPVDGEVAAERQFRSDSRAGLDDDGESEIAPGAASRPAAATKVREEVDRAVVFEIGWRPTAEGGVFELRPLDYVLDGEDVAAAVSTAEVWGWSIPPTPSPEVRRVHARMVDRLQRAGWRHCGRGEAWFAQRFERRR